MSKIRSGISQATVSAEGVISAEGNIGKNKTSGSIDSEGIWDLGIDFKVGGLGITNDYGGAITVSIAGQSITWGREGGMIHYDLGGFEVIVEARDCVVTETKKIMGIEVASHTYPDPGCKLPEPPLPFIPPLDPSVPITLEDGADTVFVIIHGELNGYNISLSGGESIIWESKSAASVTDVSSEIFELINNKRKTQFKVTEKLEAKKVRTSSSGNKRVSIVNLSATLPANSDFLYDSIGKVWVAAPITEASSFQVFLNDVPVQGNSGDTIPTLRTYVLLGSRTNCKQWIKTTKQGSESSSYYPNWYMASQTLNYTIAAIIPLGKQSSPKSKPFLQPGVPPHMNDCCEEILETLEDLKEVLHVDFFKKKKFPVPSYLLAPGCDPSHTVDAENYYHLFQKVFQALAHSTIVSPKVDIQDADAVKEGDQTINSEYLSATGWAEAVTKMLYEIVDDGNVGTNMDIRTGVTVTQLLVAVADLSYKMDCVIDCIGVTTKRSKGEVETSYNLVLDSEDKNKGFDPKKSNQQLDLNADVSTEKLLSSLLKTRKNPIVKEEIHPKSPTLFELLQELKNKH